MAEPRRVLLINSYGREFAPYDAFAGNFRTELVRQSSQPVDFFEVSLASARFEGLEQEGPFVDYLLSMFAKRPVDLVVPVGGPAVRFAQRYRPELLPSAPMLLAAVDERHLQTVALATNDVVMPVRHEPARMVENILQVLPDTTNLCVALGNSPLERFWQAVLAREFQPFTNRLSFDWFSELSFAEMQRRAAAMPPRSAILYALVAVDAEGAAFVEERALTGLYQVARAPIFGLQDTQMGRGIVGGPLMAVGDLSRNAAEVAARILNGEAPGANRFSPQRPGRPQFDWRELRRWGIREARLPSGSRIRHRQAGVWERYRWPIVGIALLCLFEAVLILGLLLNRAKRLRAESAARKLSQRLIHAHEEERARLARELHDDLTQRVARMAIDVGRLERSHDQDPAGDTIRSVRDGLVGLSADIHALSYRLHPSILEDLGLSEALQAECERFARQESIPANVSVHDLPSIDPDTALCLFRVAQESLRNVARHARARTVNVSVRSWDGGLELAVSDDGVGMNPKSQGEHPSLGLASMRERVRLLGGEFEVDSAPGQGTTILAWVPFKNAQP